MKKALLLVVCLLLILSSVYAAGKTESAKEEGKYKIAFVPKLVGIPYFNAMEAGILKAGDDLGVEVIYTGPVTADAAKQIEIIDNLITRGVDAIAVAPNDPAAITPVLKKAKEMGVLVLTSDTDGAPDVREVFINQALQKEIGYTIIDELAKSMGEEGEYAIVSGGPTAWNLNMWIAYELERQGNYPGMKLVTIRYAEEDVELAINTTLDLLNAFPNLKGILGQNSTAAPGVAEGVRRAGLSGKVAVTGNTVPSMIREYVKDGTVDSFVCWNPVDLGYLTVWAAKHLLDGNGFVEGEEYDIPGIETKPRYLSDEKVLVLGAPIIFDKDNVDNYNF